MPTLTWIGKDAVVNYLKRLVELGLLRKVGASSSTKYEVLKP